MTLLAIGDVHLGTRPARLPSDLSALGVEPRALGPEAALSATVDRAIAEGVDAVLFAGDVVDSTNARFEALRPLEAAVRRLHAAAITVLAVAGNHDVEALPRLARRIEGFKLLGEGGRWESIVLEKEGRAVLEVLGWSFPERIVRQNPVTDLLRASPAPPRHGLPRLGLVHGDLDAAESPYAPMTSRDLASVHLDAWLLGHVHRPSLRATDAAPPCGYLGSLVGLDPSETGTHGPWRISVHEGGISAEQLAIAPLRWEQLAVTLEEACHAEDVGERLLDEAERCARELHRAGTYPRALGLRACIVGRTAHFEAIRRRVLDGVWDGLNRQVGVTLVFFETVREGLSLAVDLEALARGSDPPALLARKLLVLAHEGEERRALLEAARNAMRARMEDSCWSPLAAQRSVTDPLSDDALASALSEAGVAALDALLAQRRSKGTSGP